MSKRLLPYIFLFVAAVSAVSCADDKERAVRVGDKFVKAFLVDVDFNVLIRHAVGEAARNVKSEYEKLGADGVAEMKRNAQEAKVRYKLNEQKSIFGKSCVHLVYDVSVGPDYDGIYNVELELLGYGGKWHVSFYAL